MADPISLLVVEDDPTIGEPLVEALGREGFDVRWVSTGAGALEADPADLVLLDLGLPDLDGREVCRRLRDRSAIPIIVLTARDDEVERVLLLETGADDYVLKPFGFRELVARIRAVHRRSVGPAGTGPGPTSEPAGATTGLVVDRRARRVTVDGTPVALAPREFDLLALLAVNLGRALTREEIIGSVWDEHWWGSTKTLDVHVAAVRKKLGDPRWITTLRGVGYRMDPDPSIGAVTLVDDG